jgi:hypothetical protein
MELSLVKGDNSHRIAIARFNDQGVPLNPTVSLYVEPPKSAKTKIQGFSTNETLLTESRFTQQRKANRIYRNLGAVFTPFPVKPDRNCFYISGPSGAGKSYLAAEFITEYTRRYPKNDVYLFIPTESSDPAFDDLIESMKDDEDKPGKKRTKGHIFVMPLSHITASIANGDMDNFVAEDFSKSCVLFDDFLSIVDSKTIKFISNLKHMLLETGRKLKVTVVTTSHTIADGLKTRDMIIESNMFSFFPSNINQNTINFLVKHIGLTKDQMTTILELHNTSAARWVVIGIWPVKYVMWQHGAYLL